MPRDGDGFGAHSITIGAFGAWHLPKEWPAIFRVVWAAPYTLMTNLFGQCPHFLVHRIPWDSHVIHWCAICFPIALHCFKPINSCPTSLVLFLKKKMTLMDLTTVILNSLSLSLTLSLSLSLTLSLSLSLSLSLVTILPSSRLYQETCYIGWPALAMHPWWHFMCCGSTVNDWNCWPQTVRPDIRPY